MIVLARFFALERSTTLAARSDASLVVKTSGERADARASVSRASGERRTRRHARRFSRLVSPRRTERSSARHASDGDVGRRARRDTDDETNARARRAVDGARRDTRATGRASFSHRARRVVRSNATENVTEEAFDEADLDNIVFADLSEEAAISNKSGAGATMAAPDWMTQLNRLWGGESEIPVADAKLEDIAGLLGGGLFQPLFKWMRESGSVYLLPTGPITSYVVVSDPACIKPLLFNYGASTSRARSRRLGVFVWIGRGLQELEREDSEKSRRAVFAPKVRRNHGRSVLGPCADRMVTMLESESASGPVGDEHGESIQ